MAAGRILGSVVVVLMSAGLARAQTYSLAEAPHSGDCFHYRVEMSLAGEMRVTKDDQPLALKLAATAAHDFTERLLAVSSKGLPQKSARIYETARAVIQSGSERAERSLRPERSLRVVQRPRDETLVYSPAGVLTREELELTSEHFETLTLTGLLPGRAVAVQDSWKPDPDTVQCLCHLEGLTTHELICKLEEVKDGMARVSVAGSAAGIDLGAAVKMTIQASYLYDLNHCRLVSLEWKQQDDRGQGPASPASVVETTYTLKRESVPQPDSLSDFALISVPDGDPPASMIQLAHRDPRARFDLIYDREWRVVGQNEDHLVMRLLERGDFVAQATITPWKREPAGEHLSGQDFQKALAETPGWEQSEVLQAGEVPSTETGRWIYRVSALGQMDGMKVMQNFYLVAGPGGEQVVLAFTMTPAQADKLGTRDLTLVGSIEVPGGR